MSPAFSIQRMRLYLELYFMCVPSLFCDFHIELNVVGISLRSTRSYTSLRSVSDDSRPIYS